MESKGVVKWEGKKYVKNFRNKVARTMVGIAVSVQSTTISILSVTQELRRTKPKPTANLFVLKKRQGVGPRQVAVNKATPGAPPRVITGNLRGRIYYDIEKSKHTIKALVGTNVEYGRYLEEDHDHKFLGPALKQSRNDVIKIISKMYKAKK